MQDLRQRIDQPELTPSAQVVEAVKQHGSYFDFANAMSEKHTHSLQAAALSPLDDERFQASVRDSLAAKARLDAAQQEPFEDFVAAYYA